MIKLLIFDLDGTLADTSVDITNALNYALEPFGSRQYSVEETKQMVGSGISNLLKSLIPRNKTENETDAEEVVINRFLEYYNNHLIDNTVSYPGVKETLMRLGDYKKAVLSNKREVYSVRVLEGLGLLEYFDLVWGSDSVREKKPSPVPILDLLERFQTQKEEAVVVGDSNFDVEASKAAGVKIIAVTYGFRKKEVLKDADVLIDAFEELLNVLPEMEGKG